MLELIVNSLSLDNLFLFLPTKKQFHSNMNKNRISGLIFSFTLNCVLCFNLDQLEPMIIVNDFDDSGSHFGASVTFGVSEGRRATSWIIVSSPKAKSPYKNYSTVSEPGVIWKCTLNLDEHNFCMQLNLDPIGERDLKLTQVPAELIHRDRKDYGMLGASITALGDKFVACSSRWVNAKYPGHYLMAGLCYWVFKSELLDEEAQTFDFSRRLAPLINRTRIAYIPSGVQGESTFDWAFGQSGFSAHLTKKSELILGAPGVLSWAGTVVEYSSVSGSAIPRGYERFNSGSSNVFSKVIVARAQNLVNKEIVTYFDYLGYSVTSGNFFKRKSNKTQYAAGAPRGNSLNGKVVLFTFNDETLGGQQEGIEPESPENIDLLIDPIEGSFGTYFGSVLCAVDVNGDGFDELLVGAPFETSDIGMRQATAEFLDQRIDSKNITRPLMQGTSEEENEPGKHSTSNFLLSGDEGCVFIYYSQEEDFGKTPQEICGDNRAGARFGSSMCSLGDLNLDGYNDVAIGAPYEFSYSTNGHDNEGAVYIYSGSPRRLVFSQKLTPELFSFPVKGYGYALSSELDIDQNLYPDLAVGAISTNQAIVYRSIPVVTIYGNLSASVDQLETNTGEFYVTSCLYFTGVGAPQDLKIWLKVTADTEIRKIRIVEFLEDVKIQPNKWSKSVIQYLGKWKQSGTCVNFNMKTIGDLDMATVPVTLKQEYLLEVGKEGKFQPSVFTITKNAATSLNLEKDLLWSAKLEGMETNAKFDDFKEKLPIQSINSQDVNFDTMPIPIAAVCEEDGDPVCVAHLILNPQFRTLHGQIIREQDKFVIGSEKSIILEINVLNQRERANLPITIDISWSSPPVVRTTRSDCRKTSSATSTYQHYTCNLPSPLTKNKMSSVELELDMSGIYAGSDVQENVIYFDIKGNTSSKLIEDPILRDFPLHLTHNAQLVVYGQTNEAAYYENQTVGTINFTHVFEVGVLGNSPIRGVIFQIAVPAALNIDGKRIQLLRIRQPITTYEGNKFFCNPLTGSYHSEPSRIIYEDLDDEEDELLQGSEKRKRRDTIRLRKGNSKSSSFPKVKPIRLNCATVGIECFWIECEINNFHPSYRALIELRLRAITTVATRIFSDKEKDIMIIESIGRARSIGTIHLPAQIATSRTVLRAELNSEIKAWILIVATGGGLILLTLITIFLTECGFFRRKKLEELEKLRAEQQACDQFDFEVNTEVDEGCYEYTGMSLSDPDLDFYREEEIYDELE